MKIGSRHLGVVAAMLLSGVSGLVHGQVNVTTFHNDNARTGQNTQETILTPANVNSNSFGKVFTAAVDGWVYAQPLYLANVTIGGGTHNVLYVATEHDSLYAIDADSGTIYWQVSLIAPGGSTLNSANDLNCYDLVPEIGITGTPVIDTGTGTIYLVARSKVGGNFYQYLHALNVSTGAEKFGGPMNIQASVVGTATDGNGSMVSFGTKSQNQRAGLLLENGHVVIGWASHCDETPWHGWIMSYNAATLAQEAVYNTSPNGYGDGVWMSAGGVAADASGDLYFATGNGSWNGTTDLGDSVVKLGPPSSGTFPVIDYFTPWNQSVLATNDWDVASGGVTLLPTLPNGKQLLVVQAKEGKIFLVDQNNMGKYCPNLTPACTNGDTNIVQEVLGATVGVWGVPAYWNGNVYWGPANGNTKTPDSLSAFSFNAGGSGLMSTAATSKSAQTFNYGAPVPSVSANGTTNGIVWGVDDETYAFTCTASTGTDCQTLYAFDATNLANLLYTSNQAANYRDVPVGGGAVKYITPIIANGKVYFGGQASVSAFGLLTVATPAFTPSPGSYSSAQSVTLSDGTSGAVIHYTTNGTTPTTSSTTYSGAIAVSATTTIKAIAAAPGFNNSAVASGTYTINAGLPTAATPSFTPAAGTYTGAQSVTLSDATSGAVIYYTTNGTTPTTASTLYSGAIAVSATSTIKALAVASGYTNSAVASAAYTINAAGSGTISDPSGFSSSAGFTLLGGATLSGTALQLTDGGMTEARAVWYGTQVNVQSFTTDFNFQDTAASADGFAFVIQNSAAGTSALGPAGGALGYQGIGASVAVKFDLFNNVGEGSDSTGFYVNGAIPEMPAIDMTSSGVILSSGDVMHAHLTYDGTTLTLTLTDTVTSASFTASTAINIPTTVGANTAYVGFTAGTGGASAVQSILNWTYTAGGGTTLPTAATPTFSPAAGTYTGTQSVTLSDATSGAVIYYTTNGTTPTTASTLYSGAIAVSATSTIKALAVASGYTNSAVASATYTISAAGSGTISDPSGFSSSAGFTFLGGATLSGTALQLTDGGMTEARAVWYGTQVNVQSFTTDFNFQDTAASADGFAFVIQNSAAGTSALGPAGGALGYQGIGASVAVKFDLFNNVGEGSDSTGFYVNGAIPELPAIDMTSSGVILSSGDVMHAHLTYDGTTLTLTLTDTVTSASFTASTAINIPTTVGANTAYVGFTAGTGGASAVQSILNWTYTAGGGTTLPTAATPSFTPAAGTYTAAQSVTLSDGTGGAVIHYTTNGTTPTTASTLYSGAIAVSATTTIKALAVASGYTNSAVASAAYTISAAPTAATPTFSPAAGTYTGTQSVTLSDATSGAVIYYTTNGTTPTTASTLYGGAIAVSATSTIKALAVASGYTNSAVASAAYTINAAGSGTISDPSGFSSSAGFTLLGGATLSGTALQLTDGGMTEARAVWYGTQVNVQSFTTDFNFQDTAASADGFAFVIQNSAAGTSALGPAGGALGYQGIGASVAVKFDLFNNVGEGSDSTGFYVNGAIPELPAIDMTSSGVILSSGDVMHAHLTYDGTTLTLTLTDTVTSASFTASTAINIPTTVGANTAYVGFTAGTGGASAVQSILNWTYTAGGGTTLPTAATPTFSPAAGTYTGAQSVTLSDATSGAVIYYTTNGATPTTASTLYSGAIAVSATSTIKALAVASGYTNSAVASATYTISAPTAATPTFSPAAGTYTAAQSVTLSDATTGAAIHYTTNGTTPTASSTTYSGAIAVSATTTIKALAVASGYTNSAVASAAYTISAAPTAATPSFTPAAGTYTGAQSVTLSDATSGAVIYYTTNGTTPTTASTLYSGAIAVSATSTIKALAVASGYTNSAVASAAYTINAAGSGTISDPSGFSSSAGFTLLGGATLSGTALQLTDGGMTEARAVWYGTQVNVQSFTTDFNFQDTAASADGFAFVIQNSAAGTSALGPAGGALGYQGIGSSVAVKFDLFNNVGEGSDSTGFYVNGAIPELPAIDMTSSGVILSSGDVMHAHLTYDGTTLTLTLTDTVTSASFTASTAINIPTTVGANTAYVGFTAGTGGATAVQSILNWTYTH